MASGPIRELDAEELQATFAEPMRRLGGDDKPPVVVDLKAYVATCIAALALPTTLEGIEIHHVYVADDGGAHSRPLLVRSAEPLLGPHIIDNAAARILGHRILDLPKLYGL